MVYEINIITEQKTLCRKYSTEFFPSMEHEKVGISQNVQDRLYPINGLRHYPTRDTTGWFIWAGESLSKDEKFFVPLHVKHVTEWCPEVMKYLGLPPGWRFLIAPDYCDVWFDEKLLYMDG